MIKMKPYVIIHEYFPKFERTPLDDEEERIQLLLKKKKFLEKVTQRLIASNEVDFLTSEINFPFGMTDEIEIPRNISSNIDISNKKIKSTSKIESMSRSRSNDNLSVSIETKLQMKKNNSFSQLDDLKGAIQLKRSKSDDDLQLQSPISPTSKSNPSDKNSPQAKQRKVKRKKIRIELCTQLILDEFEEKGYAAQFERDCEMWYKTLQRPGDLRLRQILQRIFLTIKYGGTLVRESKSSKQWKLWKHYPIAALLSHGSRVIIQLPQPKKLARDDSFWRWLLTGNELGNLDNVVSTSMTGARALNENRLVFRRAAATHGISELNIDKMDFNLPYNRSKIIHETKNWMGLKHSKFLGSKKYIMKEHRHWGMNVPLGGYSNLPYLYERTKDVLVLNSEEAKESIQADGDHGHIYFHYLAPTCANYGGILIGCEGSEPNKEACNGEKHTYTATSPLISPTWGLKWRKKKHPALNMGPDKYNSIFIDLATTGWKFLMEKEETWNDRMLWDGCEKPVLGKRINPKSLLESQVMAAFIM